MDRFVLERKIKALASKHNVADNGSEQK